MSKLNDQQIKQIANIFKTIVEAAGHFQEKVKEKEITQCIYSFTSVVEGYSAVADVLSFLEDEEIEKDRTQIDGSLEIIVKSLENNNLVKVNEVLQFSLLPSLRRITQNIEQKIKREENIIIGVFHVMYNPKDVYPQPRLKALIEESEKQNTQLIFFTSNDVDFQSKKVKAWTFKDQEWHQITSDLPDVINNIGVGKRSATERRLRTIVPFTSFHVGNKFSLPLKLLKNKKYAELLVPFTVCTDEEKINKFIEKNKKVVFKALTSNRGEDIYFVTKIERKYIITEHKKRIVMDEAEFSQWLKDIILAVKASYIIQRFILTRTKADEPYHFRAHVQKNSMGKWGLTFIYPRIGSKKSNLSNVATDGYIEDFHEFMMREFDENGPKYEADILRLSIEVAEHLDKLYGFAIDELGIDFAIDETGRYWMHEANNGPQTAFHEEKRAVNTIAYAKYLAENGVFYSDYVNKMNHGVFQSKLSKLPYLETTGKVVFGIIVNNFKADELMNELAEKAKEKNIIPCLFMPKNLDSEYQLIQAKVFENDEWIDRIIEYPEIIFDYSAIRGLKDREWIYEEFLDVPFINETGTQDIHISTLLQSLKENEELTEVIPSYKIIQTVRDVTKYLEMFQQVIITHNEYRKNKSLRIQNIKNNKFTVSEKKKIVEYNGVQLRHKLKEDFVKNEYVVVEDQRLHSEGHLFSYHTDLIKMKNNEWEIIGQYGEDGIGKQLDATEVLVSKFNTAANNYQKKLNELAIKIAQLLYKEHGDLVSIISIGFAVNEEYNFKLYNLKLNKVDNVFDKETYCDGILRKAELLLDKAHQ